MNTYCQIDENGVCIGVYHTNRNDFTPPEDYVITFGATQAWIGTKVWNGNAWNEYAPPVRIISKYAFVQRFTQTEFATILAAAKLDIDVEAYWTMANLATDINLDDINTSAGLDLLVAKGIITAARKAAVLA